MNHLQIKIDKLLAEKRELENNVDVYRMNYRQPGDSDYIEMFCNLEKWLQVKSNIECLKDLQMSISNSK